MNSKMFTLGSRDYINGLFVAVLVVVIGSIQQSLQTCGLDVACFNFVEIVNMALGAVLAYLLKNFATDSKGKIGGIL